METAFSLVSHALAVEDPLDGVAEKEIPSVDTAIDGSCQSGAACEMQRGHIEPAEQALKLRGLRKAP